jgi:hypothetical protein
MSKSPTASRSKKPPLTRKGDATALQTNATNDDPIGAPPDDALRRAMIAEAAYYRAERRGFAPGFELEDWLLSESELAAQALVHIRRQRLRQTTSSSSELH